MPSGGKPIRRKALLVGINYINNNPRFRLEGCYTDVEWATETLIQHYGFSKNEIRILRDDGHPSAYADPTRENFLEAVKWLTTDVQPGDLIYWHFSGHGIQAAIGTRPGFEWELTMAKELNQEDMAGGKQEALAPSDIKWEDGQWKNYISTYEFRKMIFDKIPKTALLLCIFDCCHSGTTMRNVDCPSFNKARRLDPPDTTRDLEPASGGKTRSLDLELERSFPEYCILIAGAHSSQTAADANIDGKPCGALSCYLYQHLNSNPLITYIDLVRACKADLKKKRFTQVPQLDAEEHKDNWIFAQLPPKDSTSAPAPAPVQLPTKAAPKVKYWQQEDYDGVDSAIEDMLGGGGYGGGLSHDIYAAAAARSLDGSGMYPQIPLSSVLPASQAKTLKMHGIETLEHCARMTEEEWQIIVLPLGLTLRIKNVSRRMPAIVQKNSDIDFLTPLVQRYINESDITILTL